MEGKGARIGEATQILQVGKIKTASPLAIMGVFYGDQLQAWIQDRRALAR